MRAISSRSRHLAEVDGARLDPVAVVRSYYPFCDKRIRLGECREEMLAQKPGVAVLHEELEDKTHASAQYAKKFK